MNEDFFLFIILFLSSCSNSSLPPNAPGTPGVTEIEAGQIAMEEYGLEEVRSIVIRELTDIEIENLTPEQRYLFSPLYYVIKGNIEGKNVTVFISTNHSKLHFIIKD